MDTKSGTLKEFVGEKQPVAHSPFLPVPPAAVTGRTAGKACGGAEDTGRNRFLCGRRVSVSGFASVELKLNDSFASLLYPNYSVAHSMTRTSDNGLPTLAVDLSCNDETTQGSPRFSLSFHLSHIYHKGGQHRHYYIATLI